MIHYWFSQHPHSHGMLDNSKGSQNMSLRVYVAAINNSPKGTGSWWSAVFPAARFGRRDNLWAIQFAKTDLWQQRGRGRAQRRCSLSESPRFRLFWTDYTQTTEIRLLFLLGISIAFCITFFLWSQWNRCEGPKFESFGKNRLKIQRIKWRFLAKIRQILWRCI